jgi:hypothetical protein
MFFLPPDLEASLTVLVETLMSGWLFLAERKTDEEKRWVKSRLRDEFEVFESIGPSFVVEFANIVDTLYTYRAEEFIQYVERIRAECEVGG